MHDHGKKQVNWLPKKMQCTRSLEHKTTKRFLWKVQVEGHQNQTTLLPNQTEVVSYAIVINLCSHSIAVSERIGTLESHILWFKKTEFQPNLSSVAVQGGASISRQKPGSKRGRNRNRNPPSRNDVLGDNSGTPNEKIWQNDNPFQLMLLTPNNKNTSHAKTHLTKEAMHRTTSDCHTEKGSIILFRGTFKISEKAQVKKTFTTILT